MPYGAIVVFYLTQLCSLVVMVLRKIVGKSCIGGLYKVSFEGYKSALGSSMKINVATSEAETYPNVGLFMCLHRELSDDSLKDTTWSLTRDSTLPVELT